MKERNKDNYIYLKKKNKIKKNKLFFVKLIKSQLIIIFFLHKIRIFRFHFLKHFFIDLQNIIHFWIVHSSRSKFAASSDCIFNRISPLTLCRRM